LAEPRVEIKSETNSSPLAPLRRIWLCADDYGISPSVNAAIRELIVRGRLNATSVMVATPSFDRSEARALGVLASGGARRVAIGLHVTLTAPFRPMSAGFAPLRDGAFLPLETLLLRGATRRLRRKPLIAEIATQLEAFVAGFGRAPDFVDGHQHVQLFPQIRDAVLEVARTAAPNAWLRQCGRAVPLGRRFADRKALLLDVLSRGFRRRAAALGVATSPAFAGTYDFTASADPDYAMLFASFFDRLPEHSVVMCHPGRVDAELARLDPLTTLREREYDFLASDTFAALLDAHGVSLE
jgi:predicted glycoside hydrolase/deacetylase ChbG (UPF0249 family)